MNKSSLKHGFKAKADKLAVQTRGELGLELTDPLDPPQLAEHLGIELLKLTSFSTTHEAEVITLTVTFPSDFSAALVPNDELVALVINDSHTIERQRASVTHECAHHLLGHEPQFHFANDGLRRLDNLMEEEADCLADSLLVPNDAVVAIMRKLGSIEAAAEHFGISQRLMRKRYNLSGAAYRMKYSGRNRVRASR